MPSLPSMPSMLSWDKAIQCCTRQLPDRRRHREQSTRQSARHLCYAIITLSLNWAQRQTRIGLIRINLAAVKRFTYNWFENFLFIGSNFCNIYTLLCIFIWGNEGNEGSLTVCILFFCVTITRESPLVWWVWLGLATHASHNWVSLTLLGKLSAALAAQRDRTTECHWLP